MTPEATAAMLRGKLKAVANGVPLPMGRAIAKAVREALVSRKDSE